MYISCRIQAKSEQRLVQNKGIRMEMDMKTTALESSTT